MSLWVAVGCRGLSMDFGFWKAWRRTLFLSWSFWQTPLRNSIFASESVFKNTFFWGLLWGILWDQVYEDPIHTTKNVVLTCLFSLSLFHRIIESENFKEPIRSTSSHSLFDSLFFLFKASAFIFYFYWPHYLWSIETFFKCFSITLVPICPSHYSPLPYSISFICPVFLSYRWHITLYYFKGHNITIWYMYVLWNEPHSRVSSHPSSHTVSVFLCDEYV